LTLKNIWKLPVIVGDVHCRYVAPIFLGDKVIISIGVTAISVMTVTFAYEITVRMAPHSIHRRDDYGGYDYNSKKYRAGQC
jgi:hypothetical protein